MINIHTFRSKEMIIEDQPRTFLSTSGNRNLQTTVDVTESNISFSKIIHNTKENKLIWDLLLTDSFVNTQDYLYLVYISSSLLKFIVYGTYEDSNYKVRGKIIFLNLYREATPISDDQTILLYNAIIYQNPNLKGQNVFGRIRNRVIWNYEPELLRNYRNILADRLTKTRLQIRQHMFTSYASNLPIDKAETLFPLYSEELVCILRSCTVKFFFESRLCNKYADGTKILVISTDVGFGLKLSIKEEDVSIDIFGMWYKIPKKNYNLFAIIRALFSGKDTWTYIMEWMESHASCFTENKAISFEDNSSLEITDYLCEWNNERIEKTKKEREVKKQEEYNKRCEYIKKKTGNDPRKPIYEDAMDYA